MARPPRLALAGVVLLVAVGCAGAPAPTPGARSAAPADAAAARARIVRAATAQVGAPYRYGGASPAGFDCSGLVVYSYAQAGIEDLPRTAARLEAASRPVSLDRLAPGDLLFFDLGGKKARHVGVYVGDRTFVHAPSGGKRVERVRFDHVYWGRRLRRAGRLLE